MLICQKKLQESHLKDIWEMLCASDKEFVPPLSERNSTTQQTFSKKKTDERGLTKYYKQLLQYEFVLAIDKEKVVGFIAFIPNHLLQIKNKEIVCDYVTTIVVSSGFRGQGIARKMYNVLFENRKNKNFATRTWSTNHAHIHLLEKMGFELAALLPNNRGKGIDTVYYLKESMQEN